MTAEHWNQFVDGFDVKGFANQMSEGRVGGARLGPQRENRRDRRGDARREGERPDDFQILLNRR